MGECSKSYKLILTKLTIGDKLTGAELSWYLIVQVQRCKTGSYLARIALQMG